MWVRMRGTTNARARTTPATARVRRSTKGEVTERLSHSATRGSTMAAAARSLMTQILEVSRSVVVEPTGPARRASDERGETARRGRNATPGPPSRDAGGAQETRAAKLRLSRGRG